MRPNTSFFWLIGATIFFFCVSKGIELYYNDARLLKGYTEEIATHLQYQEALIQTLIADTTFIEAQYKKSKEEPTNYSIDPSLPFNLCLYKQDKLIYWSNSIAFPNDELLGALQTQPILFRKLSNGYYRVAKYPIPTATSRGDFGVSLIPIKWSYTSTLKHLKEQFEPIDKNISGTIGISTSPTNFPIMDTDGQPICYLQEMGNFKDKTVLSWTLGLYLLSFLLLGFLLNTVALQLNQTNKAWVGPCFLLFTVFGIRYLSMYFGWTEQFDELQIFQSSFHKTNISIGDLLINIILLLWIVIFFHRESKANVISTNFSLGIRTMLTTMNYLSVVLALLLLISVFKSLVLNSGFPFNFKNVFNLEPYSIIAVMGIILLLFTQFIFSHRMMLAIRQIEMTRKGRLGALFLATLLSLPIIHFIDLHIPIYYSALIAFIFILTYDMFVDFENPGLIWLVVWIIFFAGFSSGLLNSYNYDKEVMDEFKFAQALAEEKDVLAEESLLRLDETFTAFIDKEKSLTNAEVKDAIGTIIFKENYLYNNYDYLIECPATLDSLDWAIHKTQLATQQKLEATTAPNHLRYEPSKGGHYSYQFDGTAHPLYPLSVEFTKKGQKIATIYSELLLDKTFKDLKGLDAYSFAIYKNGKVVESDGISLNKISSAFEQTPEAGTYVRQTHEEYSDFLYNHDDITFVLLSKKKNGFFHPISLFSYIFGLLIMTVLFFALINLRLKILPDNLNFDIGKKPSLKNRIQFSTILLTLVSFVVIAVISVIFLRNNWIDYHEDRLKRKVRSVQLDSEEWLQYHDNSVDFLKTRVTRLSKTHRTDVNLFDLHGNLINSSQQEIYDRGILPPKMNASAFHEFEAEPYKEFYQVEEKISDQTYKSAFVPLKGKDGMPLAYLGVPYYTKQGSLDDEISDFMGSLLNVYVFLLIIAGWSSIFFANSITRPLTTIGEKLQEVKLGKPNTPLKWDTNDEIGTLITEYNQMIVKLDDSAQLLAKSEREGAWREMAKQVAHEIKNPLTPMKLSIQYLTHAYKSRPDDIEPLMQRVSTTLIEQIDNLAHIANEFSNFAKMPRANNQEFIVNDLVESVYDLFKERDDADVLLNLPATDFPVFADKNQLMRVLNNLIKNAIEAIPANRRGKIEVSLYQEETMSIIKVSDNGMGIPEEMKKKVFVPNFTTKNSGTGLGLAISKNIIESVNGKIYYETEANVGTDFYVELPIEHNNVLEMA